MRRLYLVLIGFIVILIAAYYLHFRHIDVFRGMFERGFSQQYITHDGITIRTENDWKKYLTTQQYHILRQRGTEKPFTGALLHENRQGTYITADCGDAVFRSEQKYDAGTGWVSFWAPINDYVLEYQEDKRFLKKRTEILGRRCKGHLGHLYNDGPPPTGKRYSINSAALLFIPDEE